jgi:histidyl-tRNA synthetase
LLKQKLKNVLNWVVGRKEKSSVEKSASEKKETPKMKSEFQQVIESLNPTPEMLKTFGFETPEMFRKAAKTLLNYFEVCCDKDGGVNPNIFVWGIDFFTTIAFTLMREDESSEAEIRKLLKNCFSALASGLRKGTGGKVDLAMGPSMPEPEKGPGNGLLH